MSPPLSNWNVLKKEPVDLGVGASGGLSNAEPNIGQGEHGGASEDKAEHGAKVGGKIEIWTDKNKKPDGEEEDTNGSGGDLVSVTPNGHFGRDGVGESTDREVKADNIDVREYDNRDPHGLGEWTTTVGCTETTDNNQRDQHAACADQQIDTTAHLVTKEDGQADCCDLENVGDGIDGEGLSSADRLSEDNAVGIPKLNTVDLLSEHGTTRVDELASFDGITEYRSPARLIFHFEFHVDLILDDLHVSRAVIAWHRAVDSSERLLSRILSTLVGVPDWALWDKWEENDHESREENEQTHGNMVGVIVGDRFGTLIDTRDDEL